MQAAYRKIQLLAATGARHRSGFQLTNVTDQFIIQGAINELRELAAAPDDCAELADVFGCLLHYAVKKGWSPELLENNLLKKLAVRFTETNDKNDTITDN
jgi:hypothetical protein